MSKRISRADILTAEDLPYQDVEVPWGGGSVVRVRTLTAAERDRYELLFLQSQEAKDVNFSARATLVAFAAVNEDGSRMFEDADIPALSKKSGAVLDKLADAVRALNKLESTDVADAIKN